MRTREGIVQRIEWLASLDADEGEREADADSVRYATVLAPALGAFPATYRTRKGRIYFMWQIDGGMALLRVRKDGSLRGEVWLSEERYPNMSASAPSVGGDDE